MSKLVSSAQSTAGAQKTGPAGGGKQPMPKGDGLKTAWKDDRGGKIPLPMAKKKVR